MARQQPVWGYFALALIALVAGSTFLVSSRDQTRLPDQNDLTIVTGEIATVRVIDDLSQKATALMTPLNSVHFTLVDNPIVFRYPSRWPSYSDLYNRLAFKVDVWVDPKDLKTDEPVIIYGLRQTLPKGWTNPPIEVHYDDIVAAQAAGRQSYRLPGIVLVLLAPLAAFVGVLMVRRNRRLKRPPAAD